MDECFKSPPSSIVSRENRHQLEGAQIPQESVTLSTSTLHFEGFHVAQVDQAFARTLRCGHSEMVPPKPLQPPT